MSKLIALDDGHGINTAGKRTPVFTDGTKSELGRNYMNENLFNRAVKRYLDRHLKASGFKTVFVAPGDSDVALATRVKTANDAKADLYVSIHANANTGKWGTWGGTETYTFPSGESRRIGRIIHKHLMKGTPLRDRGVKDGSHLYVIRNTRMPAVLVECAFMDNLQEAKLLLSDSFRKECALEIAMGICEAYNVKFVNGLNEPAQSGGSNTGVMFRVRKSWSDSKSQKGAFKTLANAKDLADSLKSQGYKVFDEKGQMVYDPAPKVVEKEEWFRVRKTWSDAKSQIGAFQKLDGAKDLADLNAKEGYKVFDNNGKVVYTPNIIKENEYYRVRVSWSEPRTQIGAFKQLEGAKELADSKAKEGYKVFDDNGKIIYTPKIVEKEPEPTKPEPEKPVVKALYRVRTSWGSPKSQIGAFENLDSAKSLADSKAKDGYRVFDEDGKVVYTPKDYKEEVVVDKPACTNEKHTNILGKPETTDYVAMAEFVKEKNPRAVDIDEIAKSFVEQGNKYGIRGDIAFCQSVIETGWFRFDGGTAVTPDQHNYCGMGVTQKGMKGASFDTVVDGVKGQLHHLWAYSNKNDLPNNEKPLSPRYHLVTRGIAPHWEDLSMKWAMNENYGTHILSLYSQLKDFVDNYEHEKEEDDIVEVPSEPEDVVDEDVENSENSYNYDEDINFFAKIIMMIINKVKEILSR